MRVCFASCLGSTRKRFHLGGVGVGVGVERGLAPGFAQGFGLGCGLRFGAGVGVGAGAAAGVGVRVRVEVGSDWGAGYLGRPLASSAFSCRRASAFAFFTASIFFLGGGRDRQDWGGLGVMELGVG